MNDIGKIAFIYKGEYDPSVQYEEKDCVTYSGSTYGAKKNTLGNLPSDNSEYWFVMASGTKGSGDYVSSTEPGEDEQGINEFWMQEF